LRSILFLTTVSLLLTTSNVVPEKEFDLRLAPLVASQRFDWVGWETDVLLEETRWWLQGRPLSGDVSQQSAEVRGFLAEQHRMEDLEARIRGEYAGLPQSPAESPADSPNDQLSSVKPLERELYELWRQQTEAAPRIERIMADQTAQVLVAEGFGWGARVWPPISFRFNDMPTYLVISPRDEIRQYRGVFLLPDVSEAERARLETAIEAQLNVSALVDDVGGIGAWPTMVTDSASLRSLLDIIAHEWTHTYLFFRPLGIHYGDSRDLTTMNETVASMVGEEVADLVISDYYPELAPSSAEAGSGAEGEETQPDEFDLAMRRIRRHVDDLLAEGRVTEAETYMEVERQKLVEAGYRLRRLNQAYFAFHGSYATSPASVDPIGPWMRQLRTQSGSLKAFVDQVAGMRTLDDLLDALGEDTLSR
jgi:hypothetical protein